MITLTIKDIARESGYSVSTVSRVLNNRHDVSPQARSRIMEVVELHNFVLNSNAKQLKQSQSKTVAVIVKGTSNMLFSSIVEEMQKMIEKTKYTVSVSYLDEDENEVEHALIQCRERKPVGILFLGGNPDYFQARFEKVKIPCVLVTNDSTEFKFANLSSVSIDDVEAAKCAVDYLFEHGHSKIGIIGGDPRISYTSHLRLIGSKESFQNHKVEFCEHAYYEKAR
ncbi:MAG TPA: LacI family transcriptional regulator, partial [Lachnospiraceae bacterium]|nr:LacI family transcriptional regulator [Lachnospiraceae bacterium]